MRTKSLYLLFSILAISFISCEQDASQDATESIYPRADFRVLGLDSTGIKYIGYMNQQIVFENTSTDADIYSWDFGDGTTSTEANPTHTYKELKLFYVKLTATNTKNGKQSTVTKYILVDTQAITPQIKSMTLVDKTYQNGIYIAKVKIECNFYGYKSQVKYWGIKFDNGYCDYIEANGVRTYNVTYTFQCKNIHTTITATPYASFSTGETVSVKGASQSLTI